MTNPDCATQPDDEVQAGTSDPKHLCTTCRNINIEVLATTNGFRHLDTGPNLQQSAKLCWLCASLHHHTKQGIIQSPPDGTGIVLKLKKYPVDSSGLSFGTFVEILFDSFKPLLFRQPHFYLYTCKGDAAEKYGVLPTRHVTTTESKASFATARKWVTNCLHQHHLCAKNVLLSSDIRENSWPRRLIEIQPNYSDEFAPEIRLVDVAKRGYCPKYIALTYCWGSIKRARTTKENLEARMARVSFKSLPTTLQDAILITKRLGLSYVWIDALCIIQNCNKDWENEAAKMAYVYSRAWLTISADLSKRSTDGCFNNSRRRRAWHPFDLNGEINGILSNGSTSKLFFFSPIVPDIEEPQRLRGSPLSGRAWTLQERLLSPRVLHYTSFGLIWECRSGFCAEDNIVDWNPSSKTASRILLELSDSSNHSDMEVLYNWYHVVLTMSYALRELTFSSDKLQAISGVAKVFHQRLQCPYLAGLWLKRLEIGLAWSRFSHRNRKDEVNNRPSWSWTSQIGTITWPLLKDELDSEFKSLIIIHRFEIELFNQNDPFGRTRGCLLTVSGLLKTMHVRKIGETAFKPKFSLFNLNENEALGEVILDKEGTDEFEISCLSLFCSISTFGSFSAYFLLLSPVIGQQLKYTRVGVAHITQVRGWELLGNPEISTIILL